jgi:hypothetical protein
MFMVINLLLCIVTYVYIYIYTYIGVCANPCTVWMTRMRRADGGGGAEKPESDGPALGAQQPNGPMAQWPWKDPRMAQGFPYGGFHKWGYPKSSILMGFSIENHPYVPLDFAH